MPRALLIVCTILLSPLAYSGDKTYGSATISKVTTIYDGGTFEANIVGWRPIVGERIPIRVKGIDTPELRGKCPEENEAALKAKQFTVGMLRGAKRIELRRIERGKYFRLLADVYVDEVSLGGALIGQGLAVKYDGGTKVDWCVK